MIGYFGNIQFEVSHEHVRTFRNFTGKWTAAYAVHDILEKKQKIQFVGENLRERSLTVRFATDLVTPHGRGTRSEIDKLGSMVNSGKAWSLVIGGAPYGKYVLEGIAEDETRFDGRGVMTAATVTLQLREYN